MPTNQFCLQEFVAKKVAPQAWQLDESSKLVGSCIRDLLKVLQKSTKRNPLLLTNEELELIFSESTAVGFTLGQHLAAIERLSDSLEWQNNHPAIWNDLTTGKTLCGLATTHLVKPGSPAITGKKVKGGYKITGYAPWTCGFKIFNHLVVAFDIGDEIVYATMNFPKSLSNKNGVTIFPHKLVCINGSASVRLEFKNAVIADKDIVSTRQKTSDVKMRVSRYIGYELGIGKSALEKTKNEIEKSTHPKRLTVLKTIAKLDQRLASIIELRKNTPMDPQLSVIISEFNRDTVRLLSLTLGARALLETSAVGRWQLETILFDAVIQSPRSLELKIIGLCRN